MNLRNWSKLHTLGAIVGLLSPIVILPLTFFIMGQAQGASMEQLWFKFKLIPDIRSQLISLSIIPNLLWFYLTLNKQKYNFAMGVIIGSAIYLPYIIYIKFF